MIRAAAQAARCVRRGRRDCARASAAGVRDGPAGFGCSAAPRGGFAAFGAWFDAELDTAFAAGAARPRFRGPPR